MKPSELLEVILNNKSIISLALMSKTEQNNIIKSLDKQFIDREELKDKINNKLKYNPYKNDMCIAVYNGTLKEILELLK